MLCLLAALPVLAASPLAQAAPTYLSSPPVWDEEVGELEMLVGGISEDGATLKPSDIEVEIDGNKGPKPQWKEVFSEFAQNEAEASKRWKSPLAVGLVYLWVKDVPAGISDAMLEGLSGFFRRIPARTNVYATLYGRKRQPIPKLKASEIGAQLPDLGYIPGDKPNLADAIRVDLKALLSDESPFKIMLVVSDGRDFNDLNGETAADFTAVADEIDKANVKLMVVGFPPPEADAEPSIKSLSDLASFGGFRRATEQPLEIQSTLESLGQSIADLRRVRLEIPWGWRHFGGSHKLRLNLTTDGKRRAIEVGMVSVPANKTWLLVLIGIVLVLVASAAIVMLLRSRGGRPARGGADDDLAVLAAAHALIQRGLSASRALVELTRSFPNDVGSLAEVDESVFSDERFPLLRTRAGRRRFEELQALLTKKSSDDSLLGGDLAEALAQSISSQAPPDQAASSIAARVSEDEWSAFARLGLDELARALRASGALHPVLATPRARGVALEIQAALRTENRTSNRSMAVGWLVRAAGQGKRGETLRLPIGTRVVLGRGAASEVRLEGDAQVAEQHAAISERRGAFFIEPMQGEVKVETKPVAGRQPLGDGDTVEIGQGRYVFKCVTTGNVGHSRPS